MGILCCPIGFLLARERSRFGCGEKVQTRETPAHAKCALDSLKVSTLKRPSIRRRSPKGRILSRKLDGNIKEQELIKVVSVSQGILNEALAQPA